MGDIIQQDYAQPYLDMFRDYMNETGLSPLFKMQVIIHTEGSDITSEDNIYIHSLVIQRDYEKNIGDYIEIQISIPPGTFIEEVFPYMDNAEITVRTIKQYTVPSSGGSGNKPFISTTKYKAVYLKDKNVNIPNNKIFSKTDLNQMPSFIINFQLVDKSVEALRIKTTSGNFKDQSIDNVIRTVVSSEASKVLVENKPCLDVVDVYPPDNAGAIKSLTIPSYSRLIEVPDYMQEKSVGVYSSGLGCYIQKYAEKPTKIKTGFWVYPLYGVKRDGVETMEIYCPTQEAILTSFPGAIYKDGKYILLAHKPSIQDNDKEAAVMTSGSGFRSTDATSMMSKPVKVTSKGPIFVRETVSTEIIYKERKDGMNFAVNKGVYYNNFVLASELMKSKNNYLTLQVANLDHDVIRPGLNIYVSTLILEKLDEGKELRKKRIYDCSVLQAVFSYTNGSPNPMTNVSSKFVDLTCHATLKLCAEERIDDQAA